MAGAALPHRHGVLAGRLVEAPGEGLDAGALGTIADEQEVPRLSSGGLKCVRKEFHDLLHAMPIPNEPGESQDKPPFQAEPRPA